MTPAVPGEHRLQHGWEEARAVAASTAAPLPPVDQPLHRCLGRTLVDEVRALHDMPHYDSSAMDGWAVNGSGPWLPAEPGNRLGVHEASPVATGGALPPGTKAVLRREHAELGMDGEGFPVVRLAAGARPGGPSNGADIRAAGEEAVAGDLLVAAGTMLGPAHVALAALGGHDALRVLGRPRVGLLRTGAEVVESGVPVPGRVRDVFGLLLPPMLESLGAVPLRGRRIGDSLEEWVEGFAEGEDGPADSGGPTDVLVTTGGTGRGPTDHFRTVVAQLGGRLVVDGVAMRPGHPTVLAELPDGRFVLGLPGNPLAALVGLLAVGEPLLSVLGHREPLVPVELPCGVTFEPEPGRTRVLPFRLLYGLASPSGPHGSAMLRGLSEADGVMIVPPHGIRMGEPVRALPLPWNGPLAVLAAEAEEVPVRRRRRTTTSREPVDWSALDG